MIFKKINLNYFYKIAVGVSLISNIYGDYCSMDNPRLLGYASKLSGVIVLR